MMERAKSPWLVLLSLTLLIMVTVLVAVFTTGSTAVAQEGSLPWVENPNYLTGPVCVAAYPINPINCTAKDFGIKQIRMVNLDEACSLGTPGEFQADLEVVIAAAGPDRYNVSFFFSLDGTSALTGTNCLHGYLDPPLTETPTYVQDPLNPESTELDTIFYELWWNGQPEEPTDTCGDMERNKFSVVLLPNLRFPCVDNDGDGFVDVESCAGYSLPSSGICTDATLAYPDTPSKCRCEYFNFPFNPTAIDLASFSAARQGKGILVAWETANELDNLGFNLYRSVSRAGNRVKVNGRLIASVAPGSATGATYTFLDESAAPGRSYYYWLEDLDLNGSVSQHGPAAVKGLPGRPRPMPAP